jgi:phenylalanyl-tRNA synthetase alpha chain
MSEGKKSFLITGDVYRKDEIDYCHYPVFHQMEGVRLVEYESDVNPEEELKDVLSGLITYLFKTTESEFKPDYFPFTEPSFEANVKFNNKWMEILGCGVVHTKILDNIFGEKKYKGWAFGLGLERLSMCLNKISDIRLYWTHDERFLNQFKNNQITSFVSYPVLDNITKDISFWIPLEQVQKKDNDEFLWITINDFYEMVRNIFGDNVAEVKLADKFFHNKKQLYSHTFRITFAPNNENFDCTNPAKFNDYCNSMMIVLNKEIEKLNVALR